jgi:hypothetical protein
MSNYYHICGESIRAREFLMPSMGATPPVAAIATSLSAVHNAGQATPGTGPMGVNGPMMGRTDRGTMTRGIVVQEAGGQRQSDEERPQRRAAVAPLVDGRLAYLKAALGITEAQVAAWDAYAMAVRRRVQSMREARQELAQSEHGGGVIQRIEARITGLEAMLAAMKVAAPATETLYAALNDEQRKLADDLIEDGFGTV